jgi:ABC-type Fe3+ transport system substrate-binding protein
MENESNKQTTAVEWLVEKLQESGIPLMTDEFEMIQQAKQMENAQKAHSFHLGMEAQRLINKGKNGE